MSGKKGKKSGKKGGNAFLTAAGEIFAPTGWPNLVTTAALGTTASFVNRRKSKSKNSKSRNSRKNRYSRVNLKNK